MSIKSVKIFSFVILLWICIYSVYRMNIISFIQDDAYITLRYVENFINGNGLVFNLGDRVEGYTNFLWVIILSLIGITAKIFSFQIDLVLITQLLSQSFSIALLLLSFLFTKKIITEKYSIGGNSDLIIINLISLIPPLLISFAPPFLYWGVSGMETSLFTFLTCLSVYRYLFRYNHRTDYIFITVSVLNSLLRPEGIFVFLIILVHNYAVYFLKHSGAKNNQIAPSGLIDKNGIILYSIPVLIHITFRYLYYGYFLPNTFYAKTGFTLEHFNRGVDYVLIGIKNNFLYGILLFIPLINLVSKECRYKIIFFYFFVLTYLIFMILIGGDVLPVDRFILPVIPLVIIFTSSTINQISWLKISPVKKSILSFALIIIFSLVMIEHYIDGYDNMRTKRSYEVGLVKKMKVYAEWINRKQMEKKDAQKISVALSTIGALSFYSEAKVIDMVGLTDKYIAHNPKEVPGIDEELPVLWKERRYNADYVLEQNPDYIIFPAGAKPAGFAECAIFIQSEFYKNYYCQLIYSEELKQLLPVFTRRNENLNYEISDCNVKFVKPYIEANNLFLEMNSKKNYELLSKILDRCDDAERLCPLRKSDIDAVRGYSFYHSGDKKNAKSFFILASEKDSLNMISRFYLMNIFNDEGDHAKMIHQYKMLKKYSPDGFSSGYLIN